jgi:hypothetical protein
MTMEYLEELHRHHEEWRRRTPVLEAGRRTPVELADLIQELLGLLFFCLAGVLAGAGGWR